jgi:hypothetical protein
MDTKQKRSSYVPGRPVGARARYADKFLSDAFASWKQHGTAALEQLRTDDNKAYCQLMAGLLPKNLVLDTGEPGPLDGMTGSGRNERRHVTSNERDMPCRRGYRSRRLQAFGHRSRTAVSSGQRSPSTVPLWWQ